MDKANLPDNAGGATGSPVSLLWRESLFGDMPIERWPGEDNRSEFPWNEFVVARNHLFSGRKNDAITVWQKIVAQPRLESRHYLQAWSFLRQNGVCPPMELEKQVLGVVIEVGMPAGLDLLAAYRDYRARYLNYSGAAVVWEHCDSTLDHLIDDLLRQSELVVSQIGLWKGQRPAAPPKGCTRLSFLAPSGLYFGQASGSVMAQDPRGKAVFAASTSLLQALLARSKPPQG